MVLESGLEAQFKSSPHNQHRSPKTAILTSTASPQDIPKLLDTAD
jgi:hypothetical protein